MFHISEREFTTLVVDNRERLYKIAYSYVKNEQDALDIVSDTVYKAYINLKDLKNKNFFLTWITRILINTSIDNIRKKSKIVNVDENILDNIPFESQNFTNVKEDLKEDLYEAIDFLKEDEKTYIILRFFEDYTFKEMSEIMKIPESTIKSRVYRCICKMRNFMEGNCSDK